MIEIKDEVFKGEGQLTDLSMDFIVLAHSIVKEDSLLLAFALAKHSLGKFDPEVLEKLEGVNLDGLDEALDKFKEVKDLVKLFDFMNEDEERGDLS